jgi:putative membrane protein
MKDKIMLGIRIILFTIVVGCFACRPSTTDTSNGKAGEPTGSGGGTTDNASTGAKSAGNDTTAKTNTNSKNAAGNKTTASDKNTAGNKNAPSDKNATSDKSSASNKAAPDKNASSNTGTDSAASNIPMNGKVGSSGDFMTAIAEANLTEVKLSELAMERTKSPKVKKFAQTMLKDHNAANTELVALGQELQVKLPSSLCLECRATYDALAKQKGPAFDSVYTQLMIKDHRNVLEKFVFQSKSGSNDKIKKWAAQKVPVLQQHLSMAEALDDSTTVARGNH